MSVSAPNRKHNFDPNSYEAPEFRKDKDGNYDPTTYQTATGLRKFMHEKNLPFISKDQANEAVEKGTITVDGKVITLNDKEKVMFGKLSDGLFDRLDAGTTDTHDGWLGIKDINDSVKQSWKLHGTEKSKEGYWTDPRSNSKMTLDEAKQIGGDLLKSGVASTWKREHLDNMINQQKYGVLEDNKLVMKYIDDPRVLEALHVLRNNWDDVDVNKDGLSNSEINAWRV